MRLATGLISGERRTLAQRDAAGPAYDVTAVTGGDVRRAFGLSTEQLELPGRPEVDLADAILLPPVPDPAKIVCVGLNFATHAAEVVRDAGDHPTLFTRFASTFVGHGQPLLTPVESDTLDWEGEVVVVIGRGGRRIPAPAALEHVAGYSAMGENSVRGFQLHSAQATAGKNWDRSGSWGPWLVTADEVSEPRSLEVVTRLNGAEKQRGRLSDLVFDVPTVISYISTFTELSPGDVIATGTPSGIGHRETPPRYLRPGDVLEVELVDHLVLTNPVEADPDRPSTQL
ncbi:fumarylacetoacetate hydrolase family protein [Parafrankia elaeagni]|uniref:fumarylacetoacetate hydrolase family protein n=1 Tax=Parafrankia elaeagni TaxID=222534 RepID=UPI00039D9DE9|nr:fumarylacetoacetate hydrolase family protein [Parafrankia elaeagni]